MRKTRQPNNVILQKYQRIKYYHCQLNNNIRMENQSPNPVKHLHYHYHYNNYPSNVPTSPSKDLNETLSRSEIYERRREDSFEFTPVSTKNKMPTYANTSISSEKQLKFRMSDIVNNKIQDCDTSHDQFTNLRAKSVVEQELPQNDPRRDKSALKAEMTQQRTSGKYRESTDNSILAFYEQQIKKYRTEIDRLKMVEEECEYLRDRFYHHYEEKCKGEK